MKTTPYYSVLHSKSQGKDGKYDEERWMQGMEKEMTVIWGCSSCQWVPGCLIQLEVRSTSKENQKTAESKYMYILEFIEGKREEGSVVEFEAMLKRRRVFPYISPVFFSRNVRSRRDLTRALSLRLGLFCPSYRYAVQMSHNTHKHTAIMEKVKRKNEKRAGTE